MNLNKLAREIHENAVNKGFYKNKRTLKEYILLFISELYEAFEEYRKWGDHRIHLSFKLEDRKRCLGLHNYDECGKCKCQECWAQKPEGAIPELLDIVIRLLDYSGYYQLELKIDEISDEASELNNIFLNLNHFLLQLNEAHGQLHNYKIAYIIKYIFTYIENIKKEETNYKEIDIEYWIRRKMNYNSIRPKMHGKKL